MHTTKLIFGTLVGIGLLISGCEAPSSETLTPVGGSSFNAVRNTFEEPERVHLLRMTVENNTDFANVVSSVDVGIAFNRITERCEFLPPIAPEIANRESAPTHFYSSIAADGTPDPEDVFFDGDGSFRHGDPQEDFRNTQKPRVPGIRFTRIQNKPDTLEYKIHFAYQHVAWFNTYHLRLGFRIQTVHEDDGSCSATPLLCLHPKAEGGCADREYPVQKIRVTAYSHYAALRANRAIEKSEALVEIEGRHKWVLLPETEQ